MPSARRHRYSRPRGVVEAEPLILVVTEGTKTEPQYFRALQQHLHLAATQIVVRPADGTDPRSVVRSAMALVRARSLGARRGEGVRYGETWVVFDSEHRLGSAELTAALDMAAAAKIHVAMSSPCFEFWLVLHFEYTTQYMVNYTAAESRLKMHIAAYDKSNLPMPVLLPLVPIAVENARRCIIAQDETNSEVPRTEVHNLVARMNEATRPHYRILE